MTLLLAHPPAEDLGRFVEGTLPDTERREVVAHIADCDECRILVVDSAEFTEPAKRESSQWWKAVAAAVVVAAAIGPIYVWHQHDPATDLAAATTGLKSRRVEARLSGFPYHEWTVTRGDGGETDSDPATLKLENEAGAILEHNGTDAKTLHAQGLAHLLVRERTTAVSELTAAALKKPNEARYWSDLAAAQLAAGNLEKALDATDRALAIDARLSDALFNRAVVLQRAERLKDASEAYAAYLRVDPISPWADEARRRLDSIRQNP
jgi:tetratricopeptide (TPR) repeat protein